MKAVNHDTLADLRRSKGLSITDVARAMRSQRPYLSGFERGKEPVSDEFMKRYARAVRARKSTVALRYWQAVRGYAAARLREAEQGIRKLRAKNSPLQT